MSWHPAKWGCENPRELPKWSPEVVALTWIAALCWCVAIWSWIGKLLRAVF